MSAEKLNKNTKMFGYLEKRGKMTLTGRWKRWWCVLEGQLLLYYKSETQYLKLAPCCGSLNIALVTTIRPHTGCRIYIETHSQLVILRTKTKEKQQSWFHALISVLPPDNYPNPTGNRATLIQWDSRWISERHKTCYKRRSMKKRFGTFRRRSSKSPLQFGTFAKVSNEKIVGSSENIEPSSVCDLNNQIFKEIQNNKKFAQPEKIVLDFNKNLSTSNLKTDTHINSVQIERCSSYHHITNVNSDSGKDEVEIKRSISCERLYLSVYNRKDNVGVPQNMHHEKYESFAETASSLPETNHRNSNAKVLRDTKKKLVERRPLRFLKKILYNRKLQQSEEIVEPKHTNKEQGLQEHDTEVQVTAPSPCIIEDVTEIRVSGENVEEVTNAEPTKSDGKQGLEPVLDEHESGDMEESRSLLWVRGSDYPAEKKSPGLPVKRKVNSSEYSSKIAELNSNPYDLVGKAESEPRNSHASSDLDNMLLQLNNFYFNPENVMTESGEHSTTDEDPDYDFPIPHASLIDRTEDQKLTQVRECSSSSTDLTVSRCETLISLDMTPDSLEVLPWTLTHPKRISSWLTEDDYHFYTDCDSESDNDALYHDSLNSSRICS